MSTVVSVTRGPSCYRRRASRSSPASKQYRIDATNNFALADTKVTKVADRAQGGVTVAGKWARAQRSTNDANCAEQGVDLIVVTGASATPAP
ncbi:MAG: hypothetical protein RL701_5448 [Pseudomonadota bacterium]|jgi:hypothetical protein